MLLAGLAGSGIAYAAFADRQHARPQGDGTAYTSTGWHVTPAGFEVWLKEFKGYQKAGVMPTAQFIKFPRDHTAGTSPGANTPRAMVADSDYALGKLVDTVSHSPFWRDTAIFVIEDDAQDGPDHVDAHRVLAQVITPYTQTGRVDSTFYSSMSMLRTMELILGVKPMTQFEQQRRLW